MLHMCETNLPLILASDEPDAVEVLNADGGAPICLVCEHASPFIPASLNGLGLSEDQALSHAVWDPGAEAVAQALSFLLDAPLVAARISRLVYDCNRPPEADGAMTRRSEDILIPGNMNLSDEQRAARVREVYEPFRQALSQTLDGFVQEPVMVTIHSFTPVWHGLPRDTEIGLLHDADPALARAMLAAAPQDLRVELNAPYAASDGVTHTLAEHATARGLANVMIEIRNDLIDTRDKAEAMAGTLAHMLLGALSSGVARGWA